MSTFPAIRPVSRSFTPGSVPVSTFTAISGKETRVILGDTPMGHELSLGFDNITEDVAQQFLDHFRGQIGTALSFTLPPEVYAGWSQYLVEVPADQKWRYAGAPSVETVAPSIMSVGVSLVGLN